MARTPIIIDADYGIHARFKLLFPKDGHQPEHRVVVVPLFGRYDDCAAAWEAARRSFEAMTPSELAHLRTKALPIDAISARIFFRPEAVRAIVPSVLQTVTAGTTAPPRPAPDYSRKMCDSFGKGML